MQITTICKTVLTTLSVLASGTVARAEIQSALELMSKTYAMRAVYPFVDTGCADSNKCSLGYSAQQIQLGDILKPNKRVTAQGDSPCRLGGASDRLGSPPAQSSTSIVLTPPDRQLLDLLPQQIQARIPNDAQRVGIGLTDTVIQNVRIPSDEFLSEAVSQCPQQIVMDRFLVVVGIAAARIRGFSSPEIPMQSSSPADGIGGDPSGGIRTNNFYIVGYRRLLVCRMSNSTFAIGRDCSKQKERH